MAGLCSAIAPGGWGAELGARGAVSDPGDLFFCTKPQVDAALAGNSAALSGAADLGRDCWERHRRLVTIGRQPRLVGDVIDNAVRAARTGLPADDALVGHPASAGRATGRVRVVHGPGDFAAFRAGDIIVARATSPAWTPLFAHAAAVVTDGGIGTQEESSSIAAQRLWVGVMALRDLRATRGTSNAPAGGLCVNEPE